MKTKTKFCGIKDYKTLKYCLRMNIDCLGFVFYKKSSRNISLKKAINLFLKIPPFIIKVGVFVNPKFSFIKRVTRNIHLDLIQYSGFESFSFCDEVYKKNRIPWIKVIKIKNLNKKIYKKIKNSRKEIVFLDKKTISSYGGDGKIISLKYLKPFKKKIVLSGGLNYCNVRRSVTKLKPYFVDVSSGIEINLKKNINLMKKFNSEVKLANKYETK